MVKSLFLDRLIRQLPQHNTPLYCFIFIIIIGFSLRLYNAIHSGVPNSDAAFYIDHARIIYYGLWDLISLREHFYKSFYPLLIALAYPLAGNWITAAYAVSIVLGVLLLFPVYALSRKFLRVETSLLVALTYAVLPTLVFSGSQMLRDPLYWLFIAFGLWFLSKSNVQPYGYLLLSSFSFLLATLNRHEGFVFFIVSCLYLLYRERGRKLVRIIVFLLPWLILSLAAWTMNQLTDSNILQSRWDFFSDRIANTLNNYNKVAHTLKSLSQSPPTDIPPQFFNFASTLVWLFPFGIIIYSALEAFHYLFFIIIIMGIANIKNLLKKGNDAYYFLSLVIIIIMLLYLFLFTNWEIEPRWLISLFIPAFLFLGQGFEQIIKFLSHNRWFKMSRPFAAFILAIVIVIVTLPRDLSPREQDKIVYKQIGLAIAEREKTNKEIPILIAGVGMRWVSLYANQNVTGAPYPDIYQSSYPSLISNSYPELIHNLRSRGIRYFVWEERHWPKNRYDLISHLKRDELTPIGEWYHVDSGRMILFAVVP